MPAVQVRDMDRETYELLKASAARDRRSIAQQAEYIISSYLKQEELRCRAMEPEVYDPVWGVRLRHETVPVFAEYAAPRDLTPEEVLAKRKRLKAQLDDMPKIDTTGWPNPADVIREMREERDRKVLAGVPEFEELFA